MHKKILFILAAVAMIFSNSVDAAKIDAYRNAILNKSYTIKYEISQIPIHQSKNDATFSEEGLKEKLTSFGKMQLHQGIVVADGDNSYVETNFNSVSIRHAVDGKIYTSEMPLGGVCKLVKDNEVFNFYYEIKKDKKNYYGGYSFFGKSHSVKADDNRFQTPYQNLINDYTLGNPVLSEIFSPIIPSEKLIDIPTSPTYQFVSSGTAKDGLHYEDFASNKKNIFSAIRYYFDGENLVKIAYVAYLQNGNQLQSYNKFVVDIKEFSTTPDIKYLSLPAELKVKKK